MCVCKVHGLPSSSKDQGDDIDNHYTTYNGIQNIIKNMEIPVGV